MHRWTAVVLTAVVGVTLALPAAAQWKWRDAQGRTQYSDTPPPPTVAEKDILQRPNASAPARPTAVPPAAPTSAASGAPTLAPKTEDTELDAKRKKAEQDAAARKRAEDEKIAIAKVDNCARARVQLKAIDDGQRLSRINAQGEREFLDDKGRAEEAQRARTVIASDCSK